MRKILAALLFSTATITALAQHASTHMDGGGGTASLGLQPSAQGAGADLPWQKSFPQGQSLSPVTGLKAGDEAFAVLDVKHAVLGWVFRTDRMSPVVKGHVDQIGTFVALSREGKILAVQVLEKKETPAIFKKLTAHFFKQFEGRDAAKPFDDIQAVTGATHSSRGVIRDVFLSSAELLKVVAPGVAPAN